MHSNAEVLRVWQRRRQERPFYLQAFGSEAALRQEARASLIESSSAAQLQSLLAGCLYLKGLPEESSHLAQRSHGSPHHSSGRLSRLRSIRQQAAPAWIVMATGLGLWV